MFCKCPTFLNFSFYQDGSGDQRHRIVLPDDWREFNVFSKRKLVIALVTDNGMSNWFII
jgi:hypothetical protein